MYPIQLDEFLHQIMNSFYRLGLWHHDDVTPRKSLFVKWLFSLYPLLLPISLIAGACSNSDRIENSLFLVEAAIMCVVMTVKLFYIIWRKNEILEMLQRMAIYSVHNEMECKRITGKLKRFMSIMKIFFFCSILCAVCALLIIPFIGRERKLFFSVGFPLDWKNSEFAYWLAFTFQLTEVVFSAISILFSIIMWYLLLVCGLRYESLGSELRIMGRVIVEVDENGKRRKISKLERQNAYSKDFIAAVQSHH